MAAKIGDRVRVHYTGTPTGGEVFDTSRDREPLEFTLGAGEVIAGFEDAVVGMSPGESRKCMVPADDAYGPHRGELTLEVARELLPPDFPLEVGRTIGLQSPAACGE